MKIFIKMWFLTLSFSLASPALSVERLTAVYTSIAAAYAPFWVAKDKGIFEKVQSRCTFGIYARHCAHHRRAGERRY